MKTFFILQHIFLETQKLEKAMRDSQQYKIESTS